MSLGRADRGHSVCMPFTARLWRIPHGIPLQRPNPDRRETRCGRPVQAKLGEELVNPLFTLPFPRTGPDVLSLKKERMSGARSSGKGSGDWSSEPSSRFSLTEGFSTSSGS